MQTRARQSPARRPSRAPRAQRSRIPRAKRPGPVTLQLVSRCYHHHPSPTTILTIGGRCCFRTDGPPMMMMMLTTPTAQRFLRRCCRRRHPTNVSALRPMTWFPRDHRPRWATIATTASGRLRCATRRRGALRHLGDPTQSTARTIRRASLPSAVRGMRAARLRQPRAAAQRPGASAQRGTAQK
jgi:hypothetical protein